MNSIQMKSQLMLFIEQLHTEYEAWYTVSVRRNYKWWYALQVASAVAGLLFALASAVSVSNVFKLPEQDKSYFTLFLVLLPAFSSACANIVIRFRIYDLWMIREQGRIAFQELYQEAIARATDLADDEQCRKLYLELVKRTKQIEDDQQVRFFSIGRSDTPTRPTTASPAVATATHTCPPQTPAPTTAAQHLSPPSGAQFIVDPSAPNPPSGAADSNLPKP